MEITIQKVVLCAIADTRDKVSGVPAFIVENEPLRQSVATYLARILQGVVHDLGNGVLVVVKH